MDGLTIGPSPHVDASQTSPAEYIAAGLFILLAVVQAWIMNWAVAPAIAWVIVLIPAVLGLIAIATGIRQFAWFAIGLTSVVALYTILGVGFVSFWGMMALVAWIVLHLRRTGQPLVIWSDPVCAILGGILMYLIVGRF